MSSTLQSNRGEDSWFLLIDCNQFFVSCEQVFNPKLRNKPVVVLSNHDGCVVARSKEAKKLGIPMGAPAFEWEDLFKREGVVALSPNHTLYSDMSSRVMQCMLDDIGALGGNLDPSDGIDRLEIYSVDEAFIDIVDKNPIRFAKHLRTKIYRWTGIPVSIGIAKTKTLAKLCSEIAKNLPEGVFWLEECTDPFLKKFETIDIWGIGKKTAEKLASFGIKTAFDLKNCNDLWIRKHFSVVLQRTLYELKEISCIPVEEVRRDRKSVICSRSFGEKVSLFSDLKEALSCHIASAAKTLRDEDLFAHCIEVFLMTSRFDRNPYFRQEALRFSSPTQSSFELIEKGCILLEKIYLDSLSYKKIGVVLSDLCSTPGCQLDLFTSEKKREQQHKACEVLDQINRAFGKNALFIGAQGTSRNWKRENHPSPCFTTSWDELLEIRI